MLTWFITGAGRGLGRTWAEAALERGDRVAATARDIAALDSLAARYGEAVLPLELDVTDMSGSEAAVRAAAEHFGRIDVLVNNAGYGVVGALEEVSEEQLRRVVETNLLGPWWLTRAVLPVMRANGGGHVVQVSSQTVHFQVPTLGAYQLTKWGLEGFSESLAAEVAGHGIKVTLVEPEGYATDWLGSSLQVADRMPEYAEVHAAVEKMIDEAEAGDPQATPPAIFAVVDAAEPPLRIFLGRNPQALAKATYAGRIAEWDAWEPVSVAAFGG
ncbi:SDR family NAD(P)-dependent oxidoreductase [Nocardioides sp.]|uniref:SDR family NAD(P)-dependent oxidoreductase n=1 Tax=Nocardioides sp. TaxID=35761 RepID=UPI0037847614